jgi:hypothetical protein
VYISVYKLEEWEVLALHDTSLGPGSGPPSTDLLSSLRPSAYAGGTKRVNWVNDFPHRG